MAELVYEKESYAVLGACFEVYKEKGCGFLEEVDHECLAIELELRGISFRSKAEFELTYKGRRLTSVYKPDFIVDDKIVLEIKAVSELANIHRAQLQNYLRATGYRVGLLVNFNHHPKIDYERIVV